MISYYCVISFIIIEIKKYEERLNFEVYWFKYNDWKWFGKWFKGNDFVDYVYGLWIKCVRYVLFFWNGLIKRFFRWISLGNWKNWIDNIYGDIFRCILLLLFNDG